MKIAIAQIRPEKGNIEKNIELHKEMILLALTGQAEAIFFPELSITGYEPELSEVLKVDLNDQRFGIFQEISNKERITIGIGAPTKFGEEVQISMLIFQPDTSTHKYTKQILHDDEKSYFKAGNEQIILKINDVAIAPAICYESLQKRHLENSLQKGANIYLASVAKSQKGIDKAGVYFPKTAKEKLIPILLCNCIGYCDSFESAGQSAVWNKQGKLIGKLSKTEKGVLIYDTKEEIVINLS